jgi:hypothetical protein
MSALYLNELQGQVYADAVHEFSLLRQFDQYDAFQRRDQILAWVSLLAA